MDTFETLLCTHKAVLERFLRFRLPCIADADDVMQEVCLTAYQKFDQLKDKNAFKPWILAIARNKCNDFFRRQAARMEIPIDALHESKLSYSFGGLTLVDTVSETLEKLGDKDKQMLYLYYFKNLPQAEIAARLDIPLGTVKRRLHDAKQHFKTRYPYQPEERKDGNDMKKLPERLPEYTIKASDKEPFGVKCEELMGFSIIPRLGEKTIWGLYQYPDKKRLEYTEASVTGKAEVHGIEGVEISASQYLNGKNIAIQRQFIAQLTDTHCRYLAETHYENGVRKYFTFLDDVFAKNWGFGENNCGYETDITSKSMIKRNGNEIYIAEKQETVDIVGRYIVSIDGKSYDTVCVMDIGHFDFQIATEQYLDANGRTILWRRFNRNNWAYDRYGQLWSEKLPENERITINGETYVHWYDCITDYIL